MYAEVHAGRGQVGGRAVEHDPSAQDHDPIEVVGDGAELVGDEEAGAGRR